MPWVKLTDDWYDDDALSDAHPLSLLLWACAITWSARNLRDGLIPAGRVDTLVNWRRAGVPDPTPHVDELVALGKWMPVPSGGFQIANYLSYQPSRADVLAKREAEAERQRVRRSSASRTDVLPPDSDSGTPHPVPVPEGSPSSVVVDEPGTCPQVPDDVWTEFARLKRAHAKEPVRNTTRFDLKTIENGKLEHGALAARWWATFDLTPSELAKGLVDGKAGTYWTHRRGVA